MGLASCMLWHIVWSKQQLPHAHTAKLAWEQACKPCTHRKEAGAGTGVVAGPSRLMVLRMQQRVAPLHASRKHSVRIQEFGCIGHEARRLPSCTQQRALWSPACQ